MADGGVGERVGGLAPNGAGEADACVLGDGPVVGDVAAASVGCAGQEGEGGGLPGARTGLQGDVIAGTEGVGGCPLFVGRVHSVGLSGSRVSACPTAEIR